MALVKRTLPGAEEGTSGNWIRRWFSAKRTFGFTAKVTVTSAPFGHGGIRIEHNHTVFYPTANDHRQIMTQIRLADKTALIKGLIAAQNQDSARAATTVLGQA